ncbi:MAG: LysM peptidoglycan-binding domain-containing protein [Phycisphaerae bacterium]|nr:LysM peptidoglycan-binding domain-containing protein [Phycisphaerae bacterium]
MRKDAKLGLLFSSVIVVSAGWYYVSKEKTDEPVVLADAGTAAKSPITLTTPTKTTATTDTHKPKSEPKAKLHRTGKRTPSARRPGAKHAGSRKSPSRNPAALPKRASKGVDRRHTGDKPSQPAKASVKPGATRDAAQADKRDPAMSTPNKATRKKSQRRTPATKQPTPDASAAKKIDRNKPATSKADRNKPTRQKPKNAKQPNNSVQDLFRFDKADSAPTAASPSANRTTGATQKPRTSRQQPDVATQAGSRKNTKLNTPSATRTPTQTNRSHTKSPTPKTTARHRTHTIERGDSYALLAERYYGSQHHARFLIEANPEHSDPRRLREGVVLRIPPLSDLPDLPDKQARPGTSPQRSTTGAGKRTYVVRKGDTFYEIAARVLGSSNRWPELFEMNKDVVGGKPEKLRPGQVLELPSSKTPSTKTPKPSGAG